MNQKPNTTTVERIERALVVAAYLVVLDGPIMVPIFERLERELAELRKQDDAMLRAAALLESYSVGQANAKPLLE